MMIEFDQYEGGKVFIRPESVDYVRQNVLSGYEHLTIIQVKGTQIIVEGNATEIHKNLFANEVQS